MKKCTIVTGDVSEYITLTSKGLNTDHLRCGKDAKYALFKPRSKVPSLFTCRKHEKCYKDNYWSRKCYFSWQKENLKDEKR